MGIAEFLRLHRRVAIDSCLFIYELDGNARYLPLARQVFQWLEAPHHSAVTSTLTMTEVLALPYARQDKQSVHEYYGLLSHYPNLEWIAPDLEIADLAAQFRAQHRLRTPDAIQAATAVRSGVRGLISNDPAFRRVDGLEVLLFDELL